MEKRFLYLTPDGFNNLELLCDFEGVVGIRFSSINEQERSSDDPSFLLAKNFLDAYFAARPLPFCPFFLKGITPFQKKVYEEAQRIPFGKLCTYGELSRRIESRIGSGFVSPRAVGQALKRNPILLWIPCHRIIPADGSLGGFAGGVKNKEALLRFEKEYAGGCGHEN